MGLVALDEAIERANREPVRPCRALRAVVATLYAFSNGRREFFDQFLAACEMPNGEGHLEFRLRHDRGQALSSAFNGICLALGEAHTVTLGQDIHRARRAPAPQSETYDRHHPRFRSEWEHERKRFADAMRLAAVEDHELDMSCGTPLAGVAESA